MEQYQTGWLVAIIVGAVAGWIAEKIMKSGQGLFMNIVLGIIGSVLANGLLSWLGVSFGGVIGFLVAGVSGACLLIGASRTIRRRRL
ncbi:GlsB/YeaQ/YmgE family stress response membrane protein [Asticcacaulis sp. AND118]|uniref:GlsB/YeaQ/YmgE family stress response membrane protein n=1 Tax=Asticcacaulis sp. AND118 TaxID=2840468 RepID=UPI001CFF6EAF|nr:GlsB/YeaQ/YmgE family stress response membrane protein [Asticcacaulis sp. AND118]UDF05586.1 GlsB/YeaQ/YmgE family stress response membrane protein [Asticcacaulis sp. AND118]